MRQALEDAGPGAGALVLEERFSIVPERVLDADISDAAVRLYAVLLRYGQSSGQRMPSRRTLAARPRKKSVDSSTGRSRSSSRPARSRSPASPGTG